MTSQDFPTKTLKGRIKEKLKEKRKRWKKTEKWKIEFCHSVFV